MSHKKILIKKVLNKKNVSVGSIHNLIDKLKIPVKKYKTKPALEKHLINYLNSHIEFGTYAIQGRRDYMEDFSCYYQDSSCVLSAVFDGHGGALCSKFFSQKFPKFFFRKLKQTGDPKKSLMETVKILNITFLNSKNTDGTTANILFVDKKNKKFYNLNIGDSRSLLGKSNYFKQISKDHKPTDNQERAFIRSRGGHVTDRRVNGILAMSRSFGDRNLMKYLNYTPDLFVGSTHQVKFLLHGSDGLFDVLPNSALFNITKQKLKLGESPTKIATDLVRLSYKKMSYDNITCNVLVF